jgi:hypothetical protein
MGRVFSSNAKAVKCSQFTFGVDDVAPLSLHVTTDVSGELKRFSEPNIVHSSLMTITNSACFIGCHQVHFSGRLSDLW